MVVSTLLHKTIYSIYSVAPQKNPKIPKILFKKRGVLRKLLLMVT